MNPTVLLSLLLGLALLCFGGEGLVRGSAALASRLGLTHTLNVGLILRRRKAHPSSGMDRVCTEVA
jgi:hypothetical protein